MGGGNRSYYNYYIMGNQNILTIRKIGSSNGLIIPKAVLDAQKIKLGDQLWVRPMGEDTIVLVRVPEDFYQGLIKA